MLITVVTNTLLLLSGIVSSIVVSRLLGPQGRGELAAIMNINTFLPLVVGLGLPQAQCYLTGQDRSRAGSLFGTGLVLAVAISIPAIVVAWILMPVVVGAQTQETVASARLFSLYLPIEFCLTMPFGIVFGLGHLRQWNMLRLLPALGYILAVVGVALSSHASATSVSGTYLVLLGVLVPGSWLVLRRCGAWPLHVDAREIAPMFRYGLRSMGGYICAALNQRVDQIVMAAVFPPHVLGWYAVGASWSLGLSPLPSALASTTYSRLMRSGQRSERLEAFAQMLRWGVVSSLVGGGVLLLVTPTLMPFMFGSDFTPAVSTAMVLVCASIASGVNQILEDGLRGLGLPGWPSLSQLVGLLVTITGLSVFLLRYGMMGAAVVSLLSYVSSFGVLSFVAFRHLGISPARLLAPFPAEVATVVARLRRGAFQ